MTTATQPQQFEAWKGFESGPWTEGINVRDFIQRNYTPYDGDSSFLAGPTEKTKRVWETLEKNYLSVERESVSTMLTPTPRPTLTLSRPATSQTTMTSSSVCRPIPR